LVSTVGASCSSPRSAPRRDQRLSDLRIRGLLVGVAWFGAASGSTETDAGGGFFAAGLPAGAYTFVVSNPGCDPAVVDISVAPGESVTETFTLEC
jgi:hypothetical protein